MGSTPPPDLVAKQRAWRRQHDALRAPAYRITLVGRGTVEGRRFNLGKPGDGGPERLFDADQVESELPGLRGRNARGFDIYLTPIDAGHHYLVVDDMRPGALGLLQAHGYSPCLVQSSSEGNEQAVIKASRVDRSDEQSLANALVQRLNRAWGDPAFSGVVHPFRVAGFSNRKAGRGLAFTRILHAAHSLCPKAGGELEQLRLEAAPPPMPSAPASGPTRPAFPSPGVAAPTGTIAALAAAIDRARARARAQGRPDDSSSHDFRACCVLLREGQPELDVIGALAQLAARKPRPLEYATMTVTKARAMVGNQA